MTGLSDDSRAMDARCVGDVSENLSCRAVNDHHVIAARHEHAAGRRFNRDIIRPAIALDIELLDLEILRLRHAGAATIAELPNTSAASSEDERQIN